MSKPLTRVNTSVMTPTTTTFAPVSIPVRFSSDAEVIVARSKVAVILSGCGVYDGSEITEAVSTAIHLSANGFEPCFFAPDVNQRHVVNHLTGEVETGVTRNVLVESARIARGNVKPLTEFKIDEFEGVVFPGGFGAAKNLSDYAVAQTNMSMNPHVEEIIQSALKAVRPMSFLCISPVIAAKVISNGVNLTVGHDKDDKGKWPFAGAAEHINLLGGKHTNCDVDEVCVDSEKFISSGPAYMYAKGTPSQIFDGIGAVMDVFVRHVKEARKLRKGGQTA